MFSRNLVMKIIAVTVLILSIAAAALADTVRLKDGSIIKGKIVSFSGGRFVMVIGQGDRQREMTFFADEIESIEFENGGASMPTMGDSTASTNGDTEKKKPSFVETTQGNETIITVGSARRPGGRPVDNTDSNVDPDAVATNPADDTDGPPILDDTPIGGDPIGGDPVGDEPVQPESTVPAEDPTKPAPVQIRVSVLADDTANGWTNAGWVVKKGQKIRIISNGEISLGNGRLSGPKGISTLPDDNKLIKDRPTGSLIAVIGDDNNDFIFVGEDREFVAKRDGALFLGINEGNLNDNSGSFDVIIEVEASGTD